MLYNLKVDCFCGDGLIHKFRNNCLVGFDSYLSKYPKVDRVFFSYDTSLLDKEVQKKYLDILQGMWFFGDYITNSEKIVEEGGIWFDLKTTRGFRFYSVLSLVRLMEEYPLVFQEKEFEKVTNGKEFIKFLKTIDYINYGHMPFSEGYFGNFQDFGVKTVIKEPEQDFMFITRSWESHSKTVSQFGILAAKYSSFYTAENTA